MKIGHLESQPAVAPTGTDRKAHAGAGSGSAAPEASAKVDLSPEATALGGATGEGSFDQAKVDRIAQSIRDGSYVVNHEAIADKLIANAQELLGKAGG